MLRAVIVDDQALAIKMLKIRLAENGHIDVVGTVTEPLSTLDKVNEWKPDVVFLDMEMPDIKGVELAACLLEQHKDLAIVFVTAFRDYAVEAFDVEAVDYLLKPATQEHVDRAVARLLKRKETRLNQPDDVSGSRAICFGGFQVWGANHSNPLKWRTAKVEELFAYLLHNREDSVSKYKIIEALWPESEPETADVSLHTTMYRLKKTLKDDGVDVSITFRNGAYCLKSGSDFYCDFVELEQKSVGDDTAIHAETIAYWENKLALYRGPYFGEKDYLWCMIERERLFDFFAQVSKNISRYYLQDGQIPKVVHILQNLLLQSFFDEEAHELLLQAYFYLHDQVAMVKHYDKVVAVFKEEMGIEPRRSFKLLYEKLINEI